jgi:N-methylhydantoinase A
MRYAGQGYEIEVELPGGLYDRGMLETFCQSLGRQHRESYGYEMAAKTAEIVTLRLTAIGQRVKPEFRQDKAGSSDPSSALKGYRRVFMDGAFVNIPVYERSKLQSGMRILSAAIVEQVDSTTVLFPGYDLSVDAYRNLIIERREKTNG